jgi:hypothetical protein
VKHRDNRPGIPPPILQSLQIDSVALMQQFRFSPCIRNVFCIPSDAASRNFVASSAQFCLENLRDKLRATISRDDFATLTFSNEEGRQVRLNCEALLAGHYSPFITRC